MRNIITNSTIYAACSILLIIVADSAFGADDQHLPLRNHNPFLQIFGLPQFQSAELTGQGLSTCSIILDVANHSDSGVAATESVLIDGESYYLNMSWRYGWSDNLEFGIDIPVVSHNRGFLDNPIEQWHDMFGLSNANRSGPGNQLQFSYNRSGFPELLLDSPETGLGDFRISAAYAIRKSAEGGLALRSSLKLPTGNEDEFMGSGATDFALGLYHSDNQLFSRQSLAASAFAGILVLGEGEVLAHLQKDTVGFAGVSTTWQISDRFAINSQLYGQSAYYDSDLDEIGGDSIQFAVGATFRPTKSRLAYSFGIVEDLFSDATTDVAFHFGVELRPE